MRILSLIVLTGVSLSLSAQTPKRALLALSKKDHTMAIVDPSTLKVITKVPVGPDPHEIIASSDGKFAYVSNMGGDSFHELNIIDLVTGKALPKYDTGPLIGLHGLYFIGAKVWFTAQGAKSVGRYDPSAKQVDWVIGTGQNRTHMIYVSADEKQVYTTNMGSGTVSIIEKSGNDWNQTVINAAKGCEGFDVSPDGKELWTAAGADGTIAVIDIAGKKLASTIDAKVLGANRLKFTPDGKRVLVTSLTTGDLFIIDVATKKEIKKIRLGPVLRGY